MLHSRSSFLWAVLLGMDIGRSVGGESFWINLGSAGWSTWIGLVDEGQASIRTAQLNRTWYGRAVCLPKKWWSRSALASFPFSEARLSFKREQQLSSSRRRRFGRRRDENYGWINVMQMREWFWPGFYLIALAMYSTAQVKTEERYRRVDETKDSGGCSAFDETFNEFRLVKRPLWEILLRDY